MVPLLISGTRVERLLEEEEEEEEECLMFQAWRRLTDKL